MSIRMQTLQWYRKRLFYTENNATHAKCSCYSIIPPLLSLDSSHCECSQNFRFSDTHMYKVHKYKASDNDGISELMKFKCMLCCGGGGVFFSLLLANNRKSQWATCFLFWYIDRLRKFQLVDSIEAPLRSISPAITKITASTPLKAVPYLIRNGSYVILRLFEFRCEKAIDWNDKQFEFPFHTFLSISFVNL